jgi:3',5'-cyclic AMP phosphodiesterase CpdA
MIRLAHLSDLHFGGENVRAAAAAADYVDGGGFDLMVVSGDLTRYGEPQEFAAAARFFGRLKGPSLITPGNHDAPYFAVAERLFAPFGRFEAAFGPSGEQTYLAPGLAVRGINTARGVQPRLNWSKGQIAPDQVEGALAWFAGVPPDAARIVVCHHPLAEMIGGPMSARVWRGAAAARTFAEAGVDLVLSGHIHVPFVWPYPFADGRTYAAGAGTLSVRERGAPAGFNVVEIERAAIRIAALAWTGSHYDAYRTWSVDRRRPGQGTPRPRTKCMTSETRNSTKKT